MIYLIIQAFYGQNIGFYEISKYSKQPTCVIK